VSLWLYPSPFRREFGAEMIAVFEDQLDGSAGVKGAIPVCWYAMKEAATLALPMRATDPAVIAPALSLVATSAMMIPLVWALNNPKALNALARRAFGHNH
jgi:hypothetical protein